MGDLNMSLNNVEKLKNKVNVAVRVRPFLEREQGETEKWTVEENKLRQNQTNEKSGVSSTFAFDHVFDSSEKTIQLYTTIVAPIVHESFKGFNGTIICYGQTSSGKTHTMYGGHLDKGIIPLFSEHLFEHIKGDEKCKEYLIKVGVIEIYNEKLTDVLKPENVIDVKTGKDGEVVTTNLREVKVSTTTELIDIANLAYAQRRTRETLMNDQSSRSHIVIRVSIQVAKLSNAAAEKEAGEPSDAPSSALTTSILHFVDLAGSEKQSQTGSDGDGLREAIHINKSLTNLSIVINQLSQETRRPEPREQSVLRNAVCTGPTRLPQPPNQTSHVSFRNSKLTRLLENTLRGEAYITLICNVTIANLVETKSTLFFAKKAKNIKVQPKQNFGNEQKKGILYELQQTVEEKDKEVSRLHKKLNSYQKILLEQHAAPKLTCQLNRSYEIACSDKRRHTSHLPYRLLPSDDVKLPVTEEAAREFRWGGVPCDKEVQTHGAMESTDRMSFLEEKNTATRPLEDENKTLLEGLSLQIEIITTGVEKKNQELQTELSQRTKHYEDIINQKTSEITKLTKEREEGLEKSCLLPSSINVGMETVAAFQNKLEAVCKRAEEQTDVLQTKLYHLMFTSDQFITKMTDSKGRVKTATKPRATENKVASHPTYSSMVVEAITKLAEKKGSSFQAIKKSIGDTHKLNVVKQSIHIKKALMKLVETAKLIQLTGIGASGRFKLAVKPKPAKKEAVTEKKLKTNKADSANTAANKPASKR